MDYEYVLFCVRLDGERSWTRFHACTPEDADEEARRSIALTRQNGNQLYSAELFRQTKEYDLFKLEQEAAQAQPAQASKP